ncbi:MAG TPA: thiamine phosphate synthase [Rhizomicrobium sp.]|nr:thiamine phosphate synthase [Rhizomicrobium sp.]
MSHAQAKLLREIPCHARDLPRLVLMTDDERLLHPVAAARRLPKESLVVVRARDRYRREALTASIVGIARARGLRVIVADDPVLAVRYRVDGTHFSEATAGRIAHWRALRPGWLLTASAHSLRAAARAASHGADAIFLSPVFPTRSHPDRAPHGPMRLRAIARLAPIAIYALGGIDALSVRRLRGARIAGVAAIGALAISSASN